MNEERITLEQEARGYEAESKDVLVKKIPVFIRVDGKAFKTLTKNLKKPFDELFHAAMQKTMLALCEEAQGAILGWTNSDEITIVLTDFKHWNSSPWLDYEVQKICSIAASTATLAFNKALSELVANEPDPNVVSRYEWALKNGAKFDARCFNVPEERVAAMVFWRQNDCRRNAVQAMARTCMNRKEILGQSNNELIEAMAAKGIMWDDVPLVFRRGATCVRRPEPIRGKMKWVIDEHLPRFFNEGVAYINDILLSVRVDEDEE